MSDKIYLLIDELENEKTYWLDKLSGDLKTVVLPADFKGAAVQANGRANYTMVVDDQLSGEMLRISKNNDLSLYVVLLAAFKVLLLLYTGERDILIASPMHIKDGGNFNRFILLRDFIDMEMTFLDLLMAVKKTVSDAYKNQHYPMGKIFDQLGIKNYRETFIKILMRMEGVHKKVNPDNGTHSTANGITLTFYKKGQQLKGNITYNSKLYKEITILKICEIYKGILKWAVSNVKAPLQQIEVISSLEKQKILYEFNKTSQEYPAGKTLWQLFEEQADRNPDNLALRFERKRLKYRELNQQANRLAGILNAAGVIPGMIVGLMLETSIEMAVGIMAVLKSGCAYLPVDPQHPDERVKYILDDCAVSVVLTREPFTRRIRRFKKDVTAICPGEENYREGETGTSLNIEPAVNGADIAYVIYTSGTSGQPKGVLVEQKGVVNYIYWRIVSYAYKETDITLQLLSYGFDGFVSNFYSSLLSGGTLVMVPDSRKLEFRYINELIKEIGVTNTSLVPGMYESMLDNDEDRYLKSLRFVVLAGEKASTRLIKRNKEKYPGVLLINEYGPTECTVTAAARPGMEPGDTAVIGKPIGNSRVYILDNCLKPVPVEMIGEIYIAGTGVARGYLNNVEKTAEIFMENPYEPGERFYKTGDLARWLPGGDIEFSGRKDHQAKIRGFRIEPEEIEERLVKQNQIREAVVTILEKPGGEKYLCAYIVPDKTPSNLPRLREYLAQSLPGYMIPSYFVPLENIPRLSSGKVDRKALPIPGPELHRDMEYAAPRDNVERKLVEMWSGVLGTEEGNIGIDAGFFELGGHSLKAIALVSRIHKTFNVSLPVMEIFKTSTIRGLAEYIKGAVEDKYVSIEPVEKKEYYELSSAQERLYFMSQLDPASVNYNMPQALMVEGEMEKDRLEEVFRQLVGRHEGLRTSFELIDKQPVQRIHEHAAFEIEYDEVEEEVRLRKRAQDFIRPFELNNAPLLRTGLIKSGKERYMWMIDLHHIISDRVTQELLVRDFISLYEGEELTGLGIQYKDFSEWQNGLFKTNNIKKQEAYWLDRFKDPVPELDMPTDFPRPAVMSYEGDFVGFDLGERLIRKVHELSRETGATLYMVLLAVYTILLWKYSGQENLVVGSPIVGRRYTELENIAGVFVNMLSMRNRPGGDKTFKEFLAEVKENALKAYENQDYQFPELVKQLGLERTHSRNPLFTVVFQSDILDAGETTFANLKITPYETGSTKSQFDLILGTAAADDSISMRLTYSTELFKRESVEKMTRRYVEILEQVTENKEIKLEDVVLSHSLLASKSRIQKDVHNDFGF